MREMLAITGAMKGAGAATTPRSITDGRFSGGTQGFCVGHVAPEAVDGGPDRVRRRGRPHRHRRRSPTRSTSSSTTPSSPSAREELEAPRAALHERLPRQVRPARVGRRARRHHRGLSASTAANTTSVAPAATSSDQPERRQSQLEQRGRHQRRRPASPRRSRRWPTRAPPAPRTPGARRSPGPRPAVSSSAAGNPSHRSMASSVATSFTSTATGRTRAEGRRSTPRVLGGGSLNSMATLARPRPPR